jgi:hypothetical protein
MTHLAFVVGVTLLAGARLPATQEPAKAQPVPDSATEAAWLVSPGKDPFGNIVFTSPGARRDMRFPNAQGRDATDRLPDGAGPRIVCGMTVVTVTADADPKMVMSPKPNSRVEYKMRVVSPRICRD